MVARERSYLEFDAGLLSEAFSQPGIDPREWISYGIVDPDGESDDEKSVEFDEEYGPLVNVTLHPSGKQVRARVASFIAGNGEAEWFPFIEKDEVIVALAGGSERDCVIIGRLNQGYDGFPSIVGGVDTSKNAVGFRRCRTPYVWELQKGPFLITSATTNAALLMDASGNWFVKDGEGSTMYIGSDWFGFQTKDAGYVMQMQIAPDEEKKNRFFVSVDGASSSFTLAGNDNSYLSTSKALYIATGGGRAYWHALGVEQLCCILLSLPLTPPLTDSTLKAAIYAASTLPLPPQTSEAIQVALSRQQLPPVGVLPPAIPNIACSNLVIG